MEWIKLAAPGFDLAATLESGQVFHWHREGQTFHGLIGNTPVWVRQSAPDQVEAEAGTEALVSSYLALDHDFTKIRRTLPKGDTHLKRALKYAPGIRILRQPKWECLATFITSSMKQVAHIRQISLTLREKYGEVITTREGVKLHAYPTPAALAKAGEKALRNCALGYRAGFLHQTAQLIANGKFDLEAVSALPDDEALLRLCELPGVGPKIAQCTLLFSYERLGVFPIDVWIERALRELYFSDAEDKVTSRVLKEFAHDHFGPYRGYAQQWIFHHARTSGIFSRKRD
ncbi:N-glycosylase/DNA lyase [Roseimicrobium gellanilyticum]|uniref:DNA-(apurinic or apyrimidinic site) lyase n=1 Tax=Roseimicrobium gellanilyticum TaxID=748857 RepID=A0A366HD66_9BACT|nr:DNA glycosylase [Roseimicrobium gellanilyticum]RBP39655.1 N-glycosylase/DNA lyase [Roseimicrobium gellanilyticum]